MTALALSRSGDNYGLAATSATRVIAWGDVNDVLGTGVPPPNQNDVVALVTGPGFADMALHGDGTVTAWGLSANILDLPAGLVLRVPAR
ncbi:hypothetical protein OV207_15635 [Corallococcus sp. BB11-1]|uniref:hypothetical protein n=1 Tax=Corallococcus sp. BB11-1 TaxID=2996783 RepID=UPI00226FF419|nr:hypothetical protein [Corallococcus sp. BB11-1]MCY1032902.1 hypothetical protein [Corallococcus sp. BB11-1]